MAYFYFESRQNGSTVKLEKSDTGWTRPTEITLEISRDSNNWSAWTWDEPVTVKEGEALYIKGNNPDGFGDTYSYSESKYHRFITTGSFNIGGDIRSLISSSNNSTIGCSYCFLGLFNGANIVEVSQGLLSGYTTLNDYCYAQMFRNCTSLTTAPALPATTLASSCYWRMFEGCTSLTTAPTTLPATTLAHSCYDHMFMGCTSLTTAPTLPATTLAGNCYHDMFRDCTSLITAPALPATTLAGNCYYDMFMGCTSLTTAPTLPATTLATSCYEGMFISCSSLTTAPVLPATTLTSRCYAYMFWACTGLTTAPVLPATALTEYCYEGMFYRCYSLTTAPVLPATTLDYYCYESMFRDCRLLTTAPVLPATTLADNCYENMFSGCTNLNYIKCLATNISATNCTYRWVSGVAPTGTFVKSANMSSWTMDSPNGIPVGWTVIDDAIPSITVTPDSFTGISYESASTERPTVDYVNIVMSSVTATTTADWLNIDWFDSSTKTQLEIEIDDNTGETRTATITITGADVFSGTQITTIFIQQNAHPASERYPIWQDIYYTGATQTLDYYVVVDNTETIYQGRAYVQPNQENIRINISKICQNYLNNDIEDGNEFKDGLGFLIYGNNAMRTFALYDASDDTLLHEYNYYYNWSYNAMSDNLALTTPINGHADSRMVKVGTEFVLNDKVYLNHTISSLYNNGYCGDYALYYLQRNGGWAAFLIEGNSKKTDSYEKYSYNMAFNNNTAQFEQSTYHNQITTSWEMHTGWLTDEQAQNLAFNLLASNRVFLHSLKDNEVIPVIISNSDAEYRTFKNNGNHMVRFDISLTESQKKQLL